MLSSPAFTTGSEDVLKASLDAAFVEYNLERIGHNTFASFQLGESEKGAIMVRATTEVHGLVFAGLNLKPVRFDSEVFFWLNEINRSWRWGRVFCDEQLGTLGATTTIEALVAPIPPERVKMALLELWKMNQVLQERLTISRRPSAPFDSFEQAVTLLQDWLVSSGTLCEVKGDIIKVPCETETGVEFVCDIAPEPDGGIHVVSYLSPGRIIGPNSRTFSQVQRWNRSMTFGKFVALPKQHSIVHEYFTPLDYKMRDKGYIDYVLANSGHACSKMYSFLEMYN